MAFSGTVSQTVFETRRVIEHGWRRARLAPETLTPENVDIANDCLWLILSNLANQKIPLWCVERLILPLYEGVRDLTLPIGTVDLLNTNLRYLQEVTGTDTDTSTRHTVEFDSDTFVTTVGVLWSATAVPLAFERSDDGATWTTIQTETPSAAAGEWTWYDLDSSIAALYFRVRATTGTLGFSQIYLGNSPTEITLSRINQDDWTSLPNKEFQSSRPTQFWFDRQINQPVMHLWPVPNAAATVYQITTWRHRYIMDVGTMVQEIEVPQRWYDAIIWQLALAFSAEVPDVKFDAEFQQWIEGKAAIALQTAWNEERDNSPTYIAPNISAYTR